VRINGGASFTDNPNVSLNLWASDEIDPELQGFGPQYLPPADSATGVTEMLISNNPDFSGASWEAYTTSKPWTLGQTIGLASVYVRYRDTLNNESVTYVATIWVGHRPSITTQATPTTDIVVGTQTLVGDSATLTNGYEPSGDVVFTLYSDNFCTTSAGATCTGTIVGGAASCTTNWTPTVIGTYYWQAYYAGDTKNNGFTTACNAANEQLHVIKASPSMKRLYLPFVKK
jgi:hypothetical protein